LAANDAQLFAMHVIRQCLCHIGAGMDKIQVQLLDDFGMLGEHRRHKSTGLQIAPALQLEHIPFGANDAARCQALHQTRLFVSRGCACGLPRANLPALRLDRALHGSITRWRPQDEPWIGLPPPAPPVSRISRSATSGTARLPYRSAPRAA